MIARNSLWLLPVFFPLWMNAQEGEIRMKQQLENLTEATDQEPQDDSFLQQMDYLKRHPLNLNSATANDLQTFFFLRDDQIQNLLHYRKALGSLLSIYELQAVPGWDVATIGRLLPYIRVASAVSVSQNILPRFRKGDHQLLLRFDYVPEKSKGYTEADGSSHFTGRSGQVLARYRYQYQNLLQYGLTAEKDPGEPFFSGSHSKGFDFYSLHLFARNLGVVQALALGDFTVNLGQGLIQWQSLAFHKSADVVSIKRQSPVLRPYSSAGEIYFLRGAGVTVKRKNWEATAFASSRWIDAHTESDSLTGQEIFTSFQSSGLHRTPSEIAGKNSVRQTAFGGNVRYAGSSFQVGVNAVGYRFSLPLEKSAEPYNAFALNGKAWSNASVDYSLGYRNVYLFGEAALDRNFHRAFLNGVLISVDPKVDLAFLYRNLGEKYGAVYGDAFTESTSPSNESGWYSGMRMRPGAGFTVDAYADFYRFPWLKYRVDAPSRGADYLLQLTWQPKKSIEVYGRYRYESKGGNASDTASATHFVLERPRRQWRLYGSWVLNTRYTLSSRADLVQHDPGGSNAERGYLFYVDAQVKPVARLTASLRLQYFQTGGYNSRIYAFENDVLFSYSVPAFFDRGFRYYLNWHYAVGRHLGLWLRWAQTLYANKKVIGSGPEEMNSSHKSDIKVQFQYHF